MSKHFSLTVFILACGLIALPAAELSEKWKDKLERADIAFNEAIAKAENAKFYAVQKAAKDRAALLKKAMTEATKSGDLDAANEIKAKLEAMESLGEIKPKPKNRVKLLGHEYALIQQNESWYSAKEACEQLGGHLLVINGPEELAFIDRLCESKHIVWLGASDHAENDNYVWITGGKVDTSKAALDRDHDGAADVLCYHAGNHQVIDWLSGNRLFYVCEWEP